MPVTRKDFKPPEVSYKFVELGEKTLGDTGSGGTEELYPVTLSDGAVDRHGDTVNPTGWDLANFKSNPVLLWAHDSRSLPIGSVKNVRIEGPVLRGEMKFADHAFAKDVKGLVDAKILRSVSVGFKPLEFKIAEDRDDGESWFPPLDFQKQELLELSIVPIPANPNALIDSKSAGVNLDLLRAWALKTLEACPATVAVARASLPAAPAAGDPVAAATAPAPASVARAERTPSGLPVYRAATDVFVFPDGTEVSADVLAAAKTAGASPQGPRTPEQIAALVRSAVEAAVAAERMRTTGRLD